MNNSASISGLWIESTYQMASVRPHRLTITGSYEQQQKKTVPDSKKKIKAIKIRFGINDRQKIEQTR